MANKMKLFVFNWGTDKYGAGVMLIAARNFDEANNKAKSDSQYWFHDGEPARTDIKYMGETGDAVIILSSYYQE